MPSTNKNGLLRGAESRIRRPRAMGTFGFAAGVLARLACTILALAVAAPFARAVNAGDTYDQVIAEKGKPSGRMDGGSTVVLQYLDISVKLRDGVVVSVKAVEAKPAGAPAPSAGTAPPPAAAKGAVSPEVRIRQLNEELARTVRRVREIVNQPVTQVEVTQGMKIARFPIWFHPGAGTPNFDTDDVRTTESSANYSDPNYDYAACPMHPGIAFLMSDMAFNSATKIFYVDRSVPKKKLAEYELLEINKLYRVIGRDLHELAALGQTPALNLD